MNEGAKFAASTDVGSKTVIVTRGAFHQPMATWEYR